MTELMKNEQFFEKAAVDNVERIADVLTMN